MKVLVFGHSGQVATELRRQSDVISLDRAACDLSDPMACAAAVETRAPDVVINAAAYTAVDHAEENETLATLINGHSPAAMAVACQRLNIPFLHVSTDYVFDGAKQGAWLTHDVPAPIGAYGRSKLVGETGIRAAGGQHVILRTSWVFSAHGQNFVKTMLRLAETRTELNVVADQIGGPTPAGDIAATLLTIASDMTSGNGKTGTYHYSGTPAVSWADFARTIFDTAGKKMTVNDIPSSDYPTPAARPVNSVMDCTDMLRDFGIPQPNWKKGLAAVIQDLSA